MFKKADYDRIIQIAKEAIEREGKVHALVILEAFEGWERRGDWGDVSFMMEQGQHIKKMAIVGDEKWQDDAFAFTAKGFRATAIEFFKVQYTVFRPFVIEGYSPIIPSLFMTT